MSLIEKAIGSPITMYLLYRFLNYISNYFRFAPYYRTLSMIGMVTTHVVDLCILTAFPSYLRKPKSDSVDPQASNENRDLAGGIYESVEDAVLLTGTPDSVLYTVPTQKQIWTAYFRMAVICIALFAIPAYLSYHPGLQVLNYIGTTADTCDVLIRMLASNVLTAFAPAPLSLLGQLFLFNPHLDRYTKPIIDLLANCMLTINMPYSLAGLALLSALFTSYVIYSRNRYMKGVSILETVSKIIKPCTMHLNLNRKTCSPDASVAFLFKDTITYGSTDDGLNSLRKPTSAERSSIGLLNTSMKEKDMKATRLNQVSIGKSLSKIPASDDKCRSHGVVSTPGTESITPLEHIIDLQTASDLLESHFSRGPDESLCDYHNRLKTLENSMQPSSIN